MKLAASRWLIAVVVAFPLLCAYSCAVPLGPGYHIESEKVELSFTNQPQPQLHLDGHYRLVNVGNAPLTSLDVTVPSTFWVAQQNLRVNVDGMDARVAGLLESGLRENGRMSIAHISFQAAWLPHQKKNIEIACDIASGYEERAVMARDAFAFDGGYWFPAFQAPARLFAKGESRADPTDLSIVIPKDFRVVASGQQTGRKARGDKVEYRFRMRDKDGEPFVVAGNYKEQLAKNKGTSVSFWTFQGLPEDAVKNAGERLAAAAQFFASSFVTPIRGKSSVWVVEIPENQVIKLQDTYAASMTSFPNMILLDRNSLSRHVALGQLSPNNEEIGLLSETWLQWMAHPSRQMGIMLLENYAVDAFYESQQGTSYRRKKIAEYLGQYDAARARAVEKPLAQLTSDGANDRGSTAIGKAYLFPYALEDACGQAAFRRAIGHMISTLRGREYSYDDLRAALNTECSRTADVDTLFRTWLYGTGIPQDFRQRYAVATGQQNTR